MSSADVFAQARAAQSAGDLPRALALYRQVLAVDANHFEAVYRLAILCHSLGYLDEAAAAAERMLALRPGLTAGYNLLGAVRGQQDRLDESMACFRRALTLEPTNVEVLYNLANTALMALRFDEAIDLYGRALALAPDHADAWHNLALAQMRQGAHARAAEALQREIELAPDRDDALRMLGGIRQRQRQFEAAADCYRRIVMHSADSAVTWSDLAWTLAELEQDAEAAECCRRAIELAPEMAEPHVTQGALLARRQQFEDAAACYRRALQVDPEFAEAHYNLGIVLREQNRLDEAVAEYQQVLVLNPDFNEAAANMGAILNDQGRMVEAAECYRRSYVHSQDCIWKLKEISLCPSVFESNEEIDRYRQRLLEQVHELTDWRPTFDLATLDTVGALPAFNLQFHGRNDREIREAYARLFKSSMPTSRATRGQGTPRVGIVVTDRHEEIFVRSLGGILDRLNPKLFEPVLVGSPRGLARMRSEIHRPLATLALPKSLAGSIEALQAARLDVIYYWEVGTDHQNYFLPLCRLAPVQCTSWGIQVTSGSEEVDYYLSSVLVEAEGAERQYTEKLLLARTLLTYQTRVAAPGAHSRRRWEIDDREHLYLCAQQPQKFQPDFDPILAGILRRDPLAVIVLTAYPHGSITEKLRECFVRHMPDVAGRIRFIGAQPRERYLDLTAAADVLLDPLHFGGVNSSYDGFSLHQPIVTWPGATQRGRYTLGCYRKMGITDCVADGPEQYVDIAVALGTQKDFHAAVVEKLREASHALFEDDEAVSEHERMFGELIELARGAG